MKRPSISRSGIRLAKNDYQSLGSAFTEGSDGLILVCDLRNEESFRNMAGHLKEALSNIGEGADQVPVLLMANKSDLDDHNVTSEMLKSWSEEHKDIPVYEVSAKNNTNIDAAFEELTRRIVSAESESKSN